ncbi:hypothetical protein EVAR_36714_1 [Eumeta japonica]|uniref:Uncharacterized protein n=1 Tax=Eumeta variegata TaxID=151549 RepID=A0A4C1XR52_EUMVA|nr:hypothetical protein EVAR_36714_1 [Eumeta japonica]
MPTNGRHKLLILLTREGSASYTTRPGLTLKVLDGRGYHSLPHFRNINLKDTRYRPPVRSHVQQYSPAQHAGVANASARCHATVSSC